MWSVVLGVPVTAVSLSADCFRRAAPAASLLTSTPPVPPPSTQMDEAIVRGFLGTWLPKQNALMVTAQSALAALKECGILVPASAHAAFKALLREELEEAIEAADEAEKDAFVAPMSASAAVALYGGYSDPTLAAEVTTPSPEPAAAKRARRAPSSRMLDSEGEDGEAAPAPAKAAAKKRPAKPAAAAAPPAKRRKLSAAAAAAEEEGGSDASEPSPAASVPKPRMTAKKATSAKAAAPRPAAAVASPISSPLSPVRGAPRAPAVPVPAALKNAVDPEFERRDRCFVLPVSSGSTRLYDAALVKAAHFEDSNARIFHLQLLCMDEMHGLEGKAAAAMAKKLLASGAGGLAGPGPFYLYLTWGRLAASNAGHAQYSFATQEEAIARFNKEYSERTGGVAFTRSEDEPAPHFPSPTSSSAVFLPYSRAAVGGLKGLAAVAAAAGDAFSRAYGDDGPPLEETQPLLDFKPLTVYASPSEMKGVAAARRRRGGAGGGAGKAVAPKRRVAAAAAASSSSSSSAASSSAEESDSEASVTAPAPRAAAKAALPPSPSASPAPAPRSARLRQAATKRAPVAASLSSSSSSAAASEAEPVRPVTKVPTPHAGKAPAAAPAPALPPSARPTPAKPSPREKFCSAMALPEPALAGLPPVVAATLKQLLAPEALLAALEAAGLDAPRTCTPLPSETDVRTALKGVRRCAEVFLGTSSDAASLSSAEARLDAMRDGSGTAHAVLLRPAAPAPGAPVLPALLGDRRSIAAHAQAIDTLRLVLAASSRITAARKDGKAAPLSAGLGWSLRPVAPASPLAASLTKLVTATLQPEASTATAAAPFLASLASAALSIESVIEVVDPATRKAPAQGAGEDDTAVEVAGEMQRLRRRHLLWWTGPASPSVAHALGVGAAEGSKALATAPAPASTLLGALLANAPGAAAIPGMPLPPSEVPAIGSPLGGRGAAFSPVAAAGLHLTPSSTPGVREGYLLLCEVATGRSMLSSAGDMPLAGLPARYHSVTVPGMLTLLPPAASAAAGASPSPPSSAAPHFEGEAPFPHLSYVSPAAEDEEGDAELLACMGLDAPLASGAAAEAVTPVSVVAGDVRLRTGLPASSATGAPLGDTVLVFDAGQARPRYLVKVRLTEQHVEEAGSGLEWGGCEEEVVAPIAAAAPELPLVPPTSVINTDASWADVLADQLAASSPSPVKAPVTSPAPVVKRAPAVLMEDDDEEDGASAGASADFALTQAVAATQLASEPLPTLTQAPLTQGLASGSYALSIEL